MLVGAAVQPLRAKPAERKTPRLWRGVERNADSARAGSGPAARNRGAVNAR
jgi:hypothetical protein